MLSANTVAQNPAGSVRSAVPVVHAGGAAFAAWFEVTASRPAVASPPLEHAAARSNAATPPRARRKVIPADTGFSWLSGDGQKRQKTGRGEYAAARQRSSNARGCRDGRGRGILCSLAPGPVRSLHPAPAYSFPSHSRHERSHTGTHGPQAMGLRNDLGLERPVRRQDPAREGGTVPLRAVPQR